MKSPALRAVIRSFTNDEEGNFGRWASNPHVLQMLKKAKWMLDEGHITEEEMMRGFQEQIEVGINLPSNTSIAFRKWSQYQHLHASRRHQLGYQFVFAFFSSATYQSLASDAGAAEWQSRSPGSAT